MTLPFADVSWLAVVVAAIAGAVIGFLWYMPAFLGRRWAASAGRELPSNASEMGPMLMVASIVVPLVMAYVLAVVMAGLGAASLADGLVVGFVVWLGFSATTSINSVLYEKRSMEYWMITAGYVLVSLLAMGAIIGLIR